MSHHNYVKFCFPAIGAGEAFDIVPHFHGHYIPDTSIVCGKEHVVCQKIIVWDDSIIEFYLIPTPLDFVGDAELVIFYDPLMIDQDSNICNNFLRIPVSVMCSNSRYPIPLAEESYFFIEIFLRKIFWTTHVISQFDERVVHVAILLIMVQ